ncbi:MAG: GIY-YIG nuclease family protein [Verrucomicrobiota bacterium]
MWQHKNHEVPGFTDRYNVDQLVYYELHQNAETAIRREKRLKLWRRQWKIELIEKDNPDWQDLYAKII